MQQGVKQPAYCSGGQPLLPLNSGQQGLQAVQVVQGGHHLLGHAQPGVPGIQVMFSALGQVDTHTACRTIWLLGTLELLWASGYLLRVERGQPAPTLILTFYF